MTRGVENDAPELYDRAFDALRAQGIKVNDPLCERFALLTWEGADVIVCVQEGVVNPLYPALADYKAARAIKDSLHSAGIRCARTPLNQWATLRVIE